ncbi:hypothetical protein GGS24DRAFT_484283 [Hypoxylon argillaceum]|nr:hypothetical protein GGS24DRAFT_484283 [Hypoxylon argillaceum]
MDCDDEAIDISQVDPTSRPADREVTRVALGGTGKARKRPIGSSDSHASRPSRGVKTAGEFQINIPQKLDKVCGAQDITTILSTLHRCSNRKRGRLTVEIYYAFLQRAPSKGSQLYRLMAYLSQCQQVKIFLRLLTSLGDCNNLSGKSSTIPQQFSTPLRRGRSAEETLVGELLELYRLDSGSATRSRPAERVAKQSAGLLHLLPNPRRGRDC